MTEMLLLSLVLIALGVRTFQVRHRVAHWECVWRFRADACTVELRRHAHLARLGDDSLEFPQPREFRVLSLRLGGIPLWSQQAIVSLPGESDARIGSIAAGEFDHLFARHFRMNCPRRVTRVAVRAH